MKHKAEKKRRSFTEERYRRMYSLARQFVNRVSFSDKRAEKEKPFWVFLHEKDRLGIEYAKSSTILCDDIAPNLLRAMHSRRTENTLIPQTNYGRKLTAMAYVLPERISVQLAYTTEPNPKVSRVIVFAKNPNIPVRRDARYEITLGGKPRLP